MNEIKKDFGRVCPVCGAHRPTFEEVVKTVKEQIEYDCLPFSADIAEKAQCTEICYIIAEMIMLAPATIIKIDGEEKPAELVKGVFRLIANEHVCLVLESFNSATYKIQNKKAYLRTALYNSVFELDSHYSNQAQRDLYGC